MISLLLNIGNKLAQQQRNSKRKQSAERVIERESACPIRVIHAVVNHVDHTTGVTCAKNSIKSRVKDSVKYFPIGRDRENHYHVSDHCHQITKPKHLGKKAIDPDDDLESLLNLIRPLPKPKYWYADVTSDHDTTAVKPKVIVIGDSFWWTIAAQLPLKEFFSDVPYWYYNSTVYYYPPYNSVDELDLIDELLSSDFVVLFYCATQQYRMNDGFTQKALEALGSLIEETALDSTAFVEREIQRTIADLIASHDMMKMIKEKAAQRNVSIEQALRDDAHWIVNYKIENGTLKWPALKQDTLTKQDNHGIQ